MYSPLLLFLLSSLGGAGGMCTFPKFLQTGEQTGEKWLYRVHNQGTVGLDANILSVSFLSSVMRVDTNVGFRVQPKPKPYRRQCVQELNGTHYIVQHQFSDPDTDGQITFTCMTFRQKTENVVILAESPRERDPNDTLCDNIVTQNWPLVLFRNTEVQHIPDDIAGGYDVTVQDDRKDAQEKCEPKDRLAPNRLEMGCPPSSSITFTFPNCLPDGLLMYELQPLVSVGSWTDSNYTFLILTTPLQHNTLWCLRMPVAPSGEFQAHLFLDVVCDTSPDVTETDNYLTLDLTRRAVTSVCADGLSRCDDVLDHVCDNETHYWCIKSCHNCDVASNLTSSSCVIPASYRGFWRQVSQHTETDLLIDQDTITIGNYAPFRCIKQTLDKQGVRYPLIFTSKNGCYPRFTCIEFGQRSHSVIKYKLAQTQAWPASVFGFTDPTLLCDQSMFSGEITDPEFTNIVSMSTRQAVNCHVGQEHFRFKYQTVVNNERECRGLLATSCSDPTAITIQQSECGVWDAKEYKCFASFKGRDGDHVVLTESVVDQTVRFHCWIFKHTLTDLIVLPSTDCHENSRFQIEQGQVSRHDKVLFAVQSMDHSACSETTTSVMETPLQVEVKVGLTTDILEGVGLANPTLATTCGVFRLQTAMFLLLLLLL